MEPLKTVLFVDGRNFKYNLRVFRFDFPAKKDERVSYYALDEKHFLWNKFFPGVINAFNLALGIEHRLIRVYWYNADKIRPFIKNPDLARVIVDNYKEKFPDLTIEKVLDLAKCWYDLEYKHFQLAKDQIYAAIQKNTSFLEIKYIGEYVVHPYTVWKLEKDRNDRFIYEGTRIGEKGVDVGIAADMIAKMPYYDVAVLISGDADFIPVVCYLKEHLKTVYQFSLSQGLPPKIKYLSPWLRDIADFFLSFSELELLRDYLYIESGTIPDIIKKAIEGHIKELEDKTK